MPDVTPKSWLRDENARLQWELETAQCDADDLRERLAVCQQFAPSLGVCEKCERYYPTGYLCSCGHDNSAQEKD